MQSPENSPARYLSDKGVAARYNIGKSTVWYWVKKGKLPRPYKIGENTTRWKVAELNEFDEKRETN
jgi:prophage regulatory protein